VAAVNNAPANLYKYLPPERASGVIGKLLIRLSQASVMNDIEEFKPPISGLAAEADFERRFRERANAHRATTYRLICSDLRWARALTY
jgi:hypothetical protein